MEIETINYFEPEGFYGTNEYHRVGMIKCFLATDGVVYVFETLQCFWLSDFICSYLTRLDKLAERFFFVKFELFDEKSGMFMIQDGNYNLLIQQKIPCTYIKENIRLLLAKEADGTYTCLLPSEYQATI